MRVSDLKFITLDDARFGKIQRFDNRVPNHAECEIGNGVINRSEAGGGCKYGVRGHVVDAVDGVVLCNRHAIDRLAEEKVSAERQSKPQVKE